MNEKVQLNTRVPVSLRKKIQMEAVKLDITIDAVVLSALQHFFRDYSVAERLKHYCPDDGKTEAKCES